VAVRVAAAAAAAAVVVVAAAAVVVVVVSGAGVSSVPNTSWVSSAVLSVSSNPAVVSASSSRVRQQEMNPVDTGAPSSVDIRSVVRSIPSTSWLASRVAAAVTFGP
jgi:guanyl-specific ribonuclease Sa